MGRFVQENTIEHRCLSQVCLQSGILYRMLLGIEVFTTNSVHVSFLEEFFFSLFCQNLDLETKSVEHLF